MFVRRLTIWFLVFVTSGVVGLAVPKTGYGLEICTSLKCVDRGRRKVEGVERKKKALLNPRKQTTSSRRSKDSSIIRIRALTGFRKSGEKYRIDPDSIPYEKTENVTFSSYILIWNKWGLGVSKYGSEKTILYSGTNYSKSWGENYTLDSIDLSYTFGDDWTLSLGTSVYDKGESYQLDYESETIYYYKAEKLIGRVYFSTVGFQIGAMEFLLDMRAPEFKFTDFTCTHSSCPSEASDEFVSVNPTLNLGIGYVF
jgi:hypothetical protein